MQLERITKTKTKKSRATRRGNKDSVKTIRVPTGEEFDFVFSSADDGEHPEPVRINPESKEEREKRLATRKARTLKAFQTTYENRRRKAS
jgi:hypothetical protein